MPRRRTAAPQGRYEFGRFWLWYRADRDDWCICWLAGRKVSRSSTGIGGGRADAPPQAAREALIAHANEIDRPKFIAPAAAMLDDIFADWVRDKSVQGLAAPERYVQSVTHIRRFCAQDEAFDGTVATIHKAFTERFIAYRLAEGVGGHTISRDLAALRRALTWAWRDERITAAPYIPDVDAKAKAAPRDTVLTPEQIAAFLEAGWALLERRHVHLYTMIHMSTHGRSQAILQLDADKQIRDGLIYFNAPGRRQTSKRRAAVPVAPTLAPWLDGLTGRVIRYRTALSEKRRQADPTLPEIHERDVGDIGKAFEATLIAAHRAHPSLGLAAQAEDADGTLQWLPPRKKLGETEPRPKLVGIATPNTFRHTLNTELHARGIAEAQIETAAGHLGEGTNKRNYRHLRPSYLREFVEGVEDYWREMDQLTTVHRRFEPGAKTVSIAGARMARLIERD